MAQIDAANEVSPTKAAAALTGWRLSLYRSASACAGACVATAACNRLA